VDYAHLAFGVLYAGQMLFAPEFWWKMNTAEQVANGGATFVMTYLGILITNNFTIIHFIRSDPSLNSKTFDLITAATWAAVVGAGILHTDRYAPGMLTANAGLAALMSALFLKEYLSDDAGSKKE